MDLAVELVSYTPKVPPNKRGLRTIPIDPATAKALTAHHRFQTGEALTAGPSWNEQDLVVATRDGNVVSPGNFDQTLDRRVSAAGVSV